MERPLDGMGGALARKRNQTSLLELSSVHHHDTKLYRVGVPYHSLTLLVSINCAFEIRVS